MDEHIEPAEMNAKKEKEYERPFLDRDAYTFQKVWREKLWYTDMYHKMDEDREKGKLRYVYKYKVENDNDNEK